MLLVSACQLRSRQRPRRPQTPTELDPEDHVLSPVGNEEWLRSYWNGIAGRLTRGMLAADASPGHR